MQQVKTAALISAALALALCVRPATAAGPAATPAETDPAGKFNANFNGEPPSDIVSIAPNLLAVVDHVSGFLVFVADDGIEKDRKRLPGKFRVENVRVFPDRTVLIDSGGKRKIVLPRSVQETQSIPDPKSIEVSKDDPDLAAPKVVRRKFRRLGLSAQAGSGFTKEMAIRGVTPGYLASATFLGLDGAGRAYSLGHELQILDEKADDQPPRRVVAAVVTVGRHDKTGKRVEVARIPIDQLFKVPRGRYVAVEPDGSIVALLPLQAKGPRQKSIYLYRPTFVLDEQQKNSPKPLAAAAKTSKALAASAGAANTAALPEDDPIDAPPDLKDAPVQGDPTDIKGRRKIAEMQKAAREIMTFTWKVQAANLAPAKPFDCNFKANDRDHSYELPHQLKQAKVDDIIHGVPYNWNGKSSLSDIKTELANGARAGNICSQVEHKAANSTGLDCSGFISQVWGVGTFGTDKAYKISDPLRGLNLMRWGDVFNKPNSHIRLYVGQDVTDEHGMRIRTLESTTACSGTCDVAYHIEHFHGFDIRRLAQKVK